MIHPFAIEVTEQADGASVLAVAGELDLASAPHFRQAVGDLMGMGARRIVVDLTGVDFVDSSGIGALLWADHRLQAVGGDLIAVNSCPPVERAFTLAGLSELLH